MRRRHASGSHAVPASAPLSKPEAGELARKAREGDAEARERLVTSVVPLVRRLALKASRRVGRPYLVDDLAAGALALLWERAHRYDPGRGSPCAFASRVAWCAFMHEMAVLSAPCGLPENFAGVLAGKPVGGRLGPSRATREAMAAAMAEPLPLDTGRPGAGDRFEACPGPAEAVEMADLLGRVSDLRGRLTEQERRTLALIFDAGLTNKDAGREMGVTGTRVAQIRDQAIGKFRVALGEAVAS